MAASWAWPLAHRLSLTAALNRAGAYAHGFHSPRRRANMAHSLSRGLTRATSYVQAARAIELPNRGLNNVKVDHVHHARRCREQACEFAGKPEQDFLLQVAGVFNELAAKPRDRGLGASRAMSVKRSEPALSF